MRRTLLLCGLVAALMVAGCSSNNPIALGGGFGGIVIDLAAGDTDEDLVFIYYDVLNRTPGDPADVVLDNAGSGIDKPRTIDIANNRLFVGNLNNDTVRIWNDFLNLTDGQPPDVGTKTVCEVAWRSSTVRVGQRDSDASGRGCRGTSRRRFWRWSIPRIRESEKTAAP